MQALGPQTLLAVVNKMWRSLCCIEYCKPNVETAVVNQRCGARLIRVNPTSDARLDNEAYHWQYVGQVYSSSRPSGMDSSLSAMHVLHLLRMRLCWQMLPPPHSLHRAKRVISIPAGAGIERLLGT